MQLCKTCRHWSRVNDQEYGVVPGTGACGAALQLWDVTEYSTENSDVRQLRAEHAGLRCMVVDGSNYAAELITMPDFGCVMHESV